MAYQTIEVRKITPTIGAEIHGVDLSQPLGNQQFQEVHDALMDNLVIFFRDQKLSIDQHKDFGRRFGPLHVHPNAPITFKEHPEILVIKADENSKHVAGEEWHSDVSCDLEPPMGSILYLTEVPPDGAGDTHRAAGAPPGDPSGWIGRWLQAAAPGGIGCVQGVGYAEQFGAAHVEVIRAAGSVQ